MESVILLYEDVFKKDNYSVLKRLGFQYTFIILIFSVYIYFSKNKNYVKYYPTQTDINLYKKIPRFKKQVPKKPDVKQVPKKPEPIKGQRQRPKYIISNLMN